MYNLIEYSDNSKTSGSLWQFNRDESALNAAETIIDFPSDYYKFKQKKLVKQVMMEQKMLK